MLSSDECCHVVSAVKSGECYRLVCAAMWSVLSSDEYYHLVSDVKSGECSHLVSAAIW